MTSAPTHTPGPWVPMLGEVYRIRANDGSVATVQHVHLTGRRPDHEVVANANLIAAAPALYEALSDLLAKVEFILSDTDQAEGMAALARARGESIHTRELNHEGGGQ